VTESGTGKPLDGVLVSITDCAGQSAVKPVTIRTDAQGRLRMENCPLRYGNVMLERSGSGRVVMKYVDLSKPLKAVMAKGASITGVLTDEAGKPRPNVHLSLDGDLGYPCMTTDAAGKFSVTYLPAGRYDIYVPNGENEYVATHEVDLTAGQDYIVDWKRPGEAVLEGRITLKGRPVSGVRVAAGPKSGMRLSAVAGSDKDGRYRLSFYKAGDYNMTWSVGDWMDSNKIWVNSRLTLKKGVNHVDMVLPGASISGKVVDAATGKPIAKAKVRAYVKRTDKEEIGDTGWSWQHTDPWWWPKNEAETDANGEFRVNNLPEGTWLVALKPNGSAGDVIHSLPSKVGRDADKTGVLLRVSKTGAAAVGAVDAETGKALPKSYAMCVDEWGFLYYPDRDEACTTAGCASEPKRSEQNGVLFSGLPAGKYRAMVQTESHLPTFTPFEVKPGKTTAVTAKPRTGGRIVFRLKETDGDTAPGIPWVGFKVTKPGSGKPVFEDYMGPYWGNILFLAGDTPRQSAMPIAPGTYRVEAVLRLENSPGWVGAKDDLWSWSGTVKVGQGRDAVITVPWRK
jgi:5-hydroxyisourate hydrolase-like protein (transthyretin family)